MEKTQIKEEQNIQGQIDAIKQHMKEEGVNLKKLVEVGF